MPGARQVPRWIGIAAPALIAGLKSVILKEGGVSPLMAQRIARHTFRLLLKQMQSRTRRFVLPAEEIERLKAGVSSPESLPTIFKELKKLAGVGDLPSSSGSAAKDPPRTRFKKRSASTGMFIRPFSWERLAMESRTMEVRLNADADLEETAEDTESASERPVPAAQKKRKKKKPKKRKKKKRVKREKSPRKPVKPGKEDHVSFAVTSRRSLARGVPEEVNVWAHLASEKDEMLKQAQEQHGTSTPSVKTKGPVPLKRGSVLSLELKVPQATVSPDRDTLHWLGGLTNAAFTVTVSPRCREKALAAEVVVRCHDLVIARIAFTLAVSAAGRGTEAKVAGRGRPYRRVFASYSTTDSDAVLARLQGIKKALPGIDIFLDRTHLRSGEVFKKKIEEEILSRDMLYLFWSPAAAKSKWVDWEWRCAWMAKGEGSVDPVPLRPADKAPPPDELAHLNFNDLYLSLMKK